MNELNEKVLLCDGAMGTVLYNKGVYLNTCYDELCLINPGIVKDVHREYVRSGADVIETNSFGANRFKLRKHGLEDKVLDINRAAARLAREEAGDRVFVAGSIGPLGVKIKPWGQTEAWEAEAAFAEQALALREGGVDLFILETFAEKNEIRRAIRAILEKCPGLPVVAEMTIEEDGDTPYGTAPEVFTELLEGWGAHIVGVNCGVGPAAMLQCVERMAAVTTLPISAMPNAGLPRAVDGRNIYLCSPDYLAEYAKRFILSGVKLVGGCCGTTPAHIKAMRAAIRALQPPTRIAVGDFPRPGIGEGVRSVPAREKSGLGRKLAEGRFVTSLEIVPPRGPDPSAAVEAARKLAAAGVDAVNIPDGPRASARMSPVALASILAPAAGLEIILHYTCRDRNLLGMQSDLLGIQAQGIRNLLVVTGDPPKMGDYPDATAVFDVDSVGLAGVVSSLNRGIDIGGRTMAGPTSFLIGVGANPGAINLDLEVARFERKVEAGAEFAITQPVFDIRLLEDFLRRVEHCRVPVIAGIWPLSSLRNAEFMHNEVPGASVPSRIMDRMRKAQEAGPETARREGVAIAKETVAAVRGMVRGVQISPPLGKYDLALEVLRAV